MHVCNENVLKPDVCKCMRYKIQAHHVLILVTWEPRQRTWKQELRVHNTIIANQYRDTASGSCLPADNDLLSTIRCRLHTVSEEERLDDNEMYTKRKVKVKRTFLRSWMINLKRYWLLIKGSQSQFANSLRLWNWQITIWLVVGIAIDGHYEIVMVTTNDTRYIFKITKTQNIRK